MVLMLYIDEGRTIIGVVNARRRHGDIWQLHIRIEFT